MGLFSSDSKKGSEGYADRAKRWTSADDGLHEKWGTMSASAKKAKEALLARNAAKKEKKDTRTERRSLKKTARKDKRAAVKKVRSENKPGKTRRALVGAARAFHGTDKEGNKGGFAAFGKYSQKAGAKKEKKEARVAKRAERKDTRVAKRTARKESRNA